MNRALFVVLLIICFTAVGMAQTSTLTPYPIGEIIKADPELTAQEKDALAKHQTVYRENPRHMPGGIAMVYAKAPPQSVYDAATTYSKYVEFMPGTLKIEVEKTEGAASLVFAEYKSEWPYDKIFIESVNIHDVSDPARLRMAWKATRSSFKDAYGGWTVKPYNGGSLVIYEMGFDLNWVPKALAKSSGKKRVMEVANAVAARAESGR